MIGWEQFVGWGLIWKIVEMWKKGRNLKVYCSKETQRSSDYLKERIDLSEDDTRYIEKWAEFGGTKDELVVRFIVLSGCRTKYYVHILTQ